jgi:3-deoxy-manno-octulosonate cytidylyltransferase (CMP-KDO synthetase)
MLQHVWERARQARCLSEVVVATDDERIAGAARGFGARAVMTRADHASGTDRAAEVAAADDATVVVNIQGDEPLIEPAAIDAAAEALLEDEAAPMASLMKRIEDEAEITNPNVVKVVVNLAGDAIYFSRSPLPYSRDGEARECFAHIGLYVYRREFLLGYSGLPVGPLERAERLEQLRAIENGYRIRMKETGYESLGVDTPEDLGRAEARLAALVRG